MKKFLLYSLMLVLIVPQVAFAAWWNPFTWFKKKAIAPPVEQVINQPTSTHSGPTVDELSKKIDELQRKLDEKSAQEDKTRKVDSPIKESPVPIKTAPTLKPPPVKVITPQSIPTPVMSPVINLPLNPSGECLANKNDWNKYAVLANTLDSKLTSVLQSYNDLAFGTENRPTGAVALFSYNYTRLTAGRDNFNSQVSEVRKMLESLPKPPLMKDTDFQKMKDSYLSALSSLQNSYDLALQAFKIIGEDKDGLTSSELNTSKSLFDDSATEYRKVSPSLAIPSSLNRQVQIDLAYNQGNQCRFTFYTDRTVKSTTDGEELFTKEVPQVAAQPDGSASIKISTQLPIQINDGGQSKTVMKLTCDWPDYRSVDAPPISHLDSSTVGGILPKHYGASIRRICKFTYTGNGDELSTRTFDFNF